MKVTNQVVGIYLRFKQWQKEEQKNWTVKHNLCYWTSNKLRIAMDSYKLQRTPIFTDNQRITDTDICIFVGLCVHICIHSFLLQVLYTVWCLSKLYTDKKFLKTTCKRFQKKIAQIGTNVRAHVLNPGLLARNQSAFGRSCDRPTWLRFSVIFLGLRANAELVYKFQVALHASHAAPKW
jgi:hypothetical protein